jgi:predicted proteasome-type protease
MQLFAAAASVLVLDEGSALFRQMSDDWDNAMHAAFGKLPHFPWEI